MLSFQIVSTDFLSFRETLVLDLYSQVEYFTTIFSKFSISKIDSQFGKNICSSNFAKLSFNRVEIWFNVWFLDSFRNLSIQT